MSEYNRWMNQRMFEAARQLPTAEVTRDRGAFFGSILQTLNHIAVADTIWLHRFAQHPAASGLRESLEVFPTPTALNQELASSLEELGIYRAALDEVIRTWASALTESQMDGPLNYKNMSGASQSRRYTDLVQHFFNHQTHHRGQASTLLFQAGVDIGVTDLLAIVPSGA